MFNKSIIMGRLTADPELRTTQSNIPFCGFQVAVNRQGSKNGETDYISVDTWRKTAEFVAKYFHKGQMILVEGPLQSRKYTDKNNNERIMWTINADKVSFCGDKPNNASTGYVNTPMQGYQQMPSAQTEFSSNQQNECEECGLPWEGDISDDALPF
ncbi:MAG: single-stranded DNA-binding protein [Ruminococcus sp.]|nr:single-stranded DNA-binding protein [Ruminococcus sp.]